MKRTRMIGSWINCTSASPRSRSTPVRPRGTSDRGPRGALAAVRDVLHGDVGETRREGGSFGLLERITRGDDPKAVRAPGDPPPGVLPRDGLRAVRSGGRARRFRVGQWSGPPAVSLS